MTPQALLDAVSALGYRPSVEGPVSAVADTPAASVRASAGPVKAGADGEVVVTLTPKNGNRLGGDGQAATKVVVVGTDAVASGEAKVAEAVTAAREVKLSVKVAAGAKAGEQTVVVRVTFQARKGDASAAEQTVELRVPVVVQ